MTRFPYVGGCALSHKVCTLLPTTHLRRLSLPMDRNARPSPADIATAWGGQSLVFGGFWAIDNFARILAAPRVVRSSAKCELRLSTCAPVASDDRPAEWSISRGGARWN